MMADNDNRESAFRCQAQRGAQKTTPDTAKSALSPGRASVVTMMQRMGFGTIYGLHVHNGEPVFTPPPRVVREIKFGGDNGPHAMTKWDDFVLKHQVRDFLAQLDAIGTGIILSLEVKHGLPFRMTIEEVHA